jgi:hypothetical protein
MRTLSTWRMWLAPALPSLLDDKSMWVTFSFS